MAINYPESHPSSPGFRKLEFIFDTTVGITESTFTKQRQVNEWQGARWIVRGSLPPMARASADPWIAFKGKLYGPRGTFLLGPFGERKTPRGTATGVTVNGGGQTGKTLALAGSGTLKAGDFFQVGTGSSARLYMNLNDGTLPFTADIFPPLRESPAHGAAVNLSSPKGQFRLAQSSGFDLDVAQHSGIEFEAVEAI